MNELEIAINNIKTVKQFRNSLSRSQTSFATKEERILANASKEELINTIIKLERFEFLHFLAGGFDVITDQEERIKIIKKIKIVPQGWKTDQNLLNYFLQQKDYYIVIQFELNEFLKNNLKVEAINIINMLNNKLPDEFKNNEYLLELCIQEQKGELINQFTTYLFNKSIISKYKPALVKIKNLNIENLPFIRDSEFFKLCLSEKRYDLLGYFSSDLLTDDIIEQYGIEIVKHYKDRIPYDLRDNKKLFDKVLEGRRYDLIANFDEQFITEEIISAYTKPILDTLYCRIDKIKYRTFSKKRSNITKVLSNSKTLLKMALEEHREDVILEFSSEAIDKEIVDLYGANLIDIIIENKEQWKYVNNPYLLEYCLKNKKNDMIREFDKSLYSEYIVKNYKNEIIELIEQKLLTIYSFFENQYLFEAYLQKGLPEIALKNFDEEFLTQDIVEKYYDTLKLLINDKYITNYKLRCNQYFLEKLLEENLLELVLNNFTSENYTSQIIEKYYSQIKKHIITLGFVPNSLRNNEPLLDKLLEDGMVKYTVLSPTLLFGPFSSDLFTDERIEKYYDNFIKYIKENENNVPTTLQNIYFTTKILQNMTFEELSEYYGLWFDEKLINDNFDSLVDFVNNNAETKFAKTMLNNLIFVDKYLSVCDLQMISYINFDELGGDINYLEKHFLKIVKWIQQYNQKKIPYKLIFNTNFKQLCYGNKMYDLFILFPFMTNDEQETSIDELVDKYAKLLDITESELKNKLNSLFEKNDEILFSLFPIMLSKRMNKLKIRHLLTFGIYPDIQYIIVNLNDHELDVFIKLLELIDSNDYDNTPIIYNALKNLKVYKELINHIDGQKITKEQLTNLLLVLQAEKNIYSIENIEELTNDKFNRKIIEQFISFETRLKKNEVDIEELKEMLYRKKFGLSKEKIEFLYKRYCFNKEIITNSNLPIDVKLLLIDIYELYNNNDFEKIKNNYLISDISIIDFKTTLFLESAIRKEYEKLYIKELYKIKSEHSLEQSKHLITNQESLDKLNNAQYRGKKISIYLLDGDFNLLIHALGAYSHYECPDNFLEDWQRPKMTYHGICTSFIANNQIANARAYHPILGFDIIESGGLLLSASYDIGSCKFNTKYATSNEIPCQFLPPKDQINYTRHTHNEMVIERMLYEDGKCKKRKPSYIVYLIDDINNKYNFITKEELIEEFIKQNKEQSIIEQIKTEKDVRFIITLLKNNEITSEEAYKINCAFYYEETLQAATDMSLPIVLVDRLKYAKKESNKCEELYNKFVETNNSKYMNELFETYFNNSIGCIKYTEYNLEYYNYFNEQGFNQLFENILEYITNQEDINIKITLLIDLISLLETEEEKRQNKDTGVKNTKLINLDDKTLKLKQLLENIKNELIRGEKNAIKSK